MRFRGLTNNQAALIMLVLVLFQLAALFSILKMPFKSPNTGFAVGQVLSVVQNDPPNNYYFEAIRANDIYLGTPAYRLDAGQQVILDGKESDANGYADVLTNSKCDWNATAYFTTNTPSFASCNATYCNYTCDLTLSALTPSGYYNVTSTIIDDAGASSALSKLVYVYPFTVVTPAYNGSGQGGDVILLGATPTPTPLWLPSPSPSASITPGASPTPFPTVIPEKFGLQVVLPEFINKCEIVDAKVIVRNDNDEFKSVNLNFEGRLAALDLMPHESKSVFFKVKAQRLDVMEPKEFVLGANLYYQGAKVASASRNIKLLVKSIDICVTQLPEQRFIPLAGRRSTFKIDLTIATFKKGLTMEVEATKNEDNLFLDLVDPNGHYYDKSFYVYDTGIYDFRARLRDGLNTVDEKLEKVKIG